MYSLGNIISFGAWGLVIIVILANTVLCAAGAIFRSQGKPCKTPLNQDGYCVYYKNCDLYNYFRDELIHDDSDEIETYLSHSICSLKDETICCKADEQDTDVPDYMSYFVELDQISLRQLQKMTCGTVNITNIGDQSNVLEFPYLAVLEYNNNPKEIKCAGALISNEFVLTAAHCVLENFNQLTGVRLGEYNISKEKDCQSEGNVDAALCGARVEKYGIADILIYPNYNALLKVDNIALIRLDRIVELKPHIQPVCLPVTVGSPFPNRNFLLSGWGINGSDIRSNVLLNTGVKVSDHSLCEKEFGYGLHWNEFCIETFEDGKDVCIGESGGPLVQLANLQKDKLQYVLYGIESSVAFDCNQTKHSTRIYTNILPFMRWIIKSLTLNSDF